MVLSPETSAPGLSGHWYHLSACLWFLGDSWRWTFGGSKQTFQTRETLETRGARRKKQWKVNGKVWNVRKIYSTRITTGNELMDGVPKSKQDFHDDKGQRCVKMGQDLHGCKTSDRQDAFALKVTSKGLWETLSLFRRWGLCTNCHTKNLQF